MKSFRSFLSEGANLAPSELYKYDWRLELFIDKLKNGSDMTLVNGATVSLHYDAEAESRLRAKKDPGKIQFRGYDNATYTLKDFSKTKEFGGGGGSGAGADVTQLTESAQAVYAAAKWLGAKTYNTAELTKGYAHSDVDDSLERILNDLPEEWRKSCILGAEELYSKFHGKGYTFHRGSAWVDRLEKTFKSINSKEKAFSNVNKWSPADIYMVSPTGKNIHLDKAQSIAELNSMLTDALRSKDIIGVSLKLLKKEAHLSYYNFDSKKKIIDFDHFTTGNKGFFSGKDIYMYFTHEGKIQFRTFPETFQGEIKGKNANQGKLSYGPIQTILRNLKLPQLIDVKKLRSGLLKNDSVLYKEFYSNYTRYSKDAVKLSYIAFVEQCVDKGISWSFSKFLGCELIDIISKSSQEDEFITACISYASSSSDLSAPFIKIE
jgi:hypothetical protein